MTFFKLPFAFCLGLAIAAVLSPCVSAQEVDVSGRWEGIYHNSAVSYQTATAVLSQDGLAVSGTYSTSTGTSGTMTGTINGTVLEFSIVHTGSCEGIFLGTGHIRSEVLTLKMGGYDCVAEGITTVVLARNKISLSPWVQVSKVRYADSVERGCFWSALNAPHPENIQSVSVVTPNYYEFAMQPDEDDNRWESSWCGFEVDKADLIFPNGIYYFNIRYLDGTTATAGCVHEADYPTAYPVITAPSHGDLIDPDNSLLVSWEPADPSVDAIYASAGDHPGSMYPALTTQFIVPEGSLGDPMRHDIWLSFSSNSIHGNGDKALVSTIDFFTGSRLVDAWAGLVKAQAPSGESGVAFIARVETAGLSSASISTPLGESIPFTQDPRSKEWVIEIILTAEQAAGRFTDGSYLLDADFLAGQDETRTIQLEGTFPQTIPNITSPPNNAVVDKYAPSLDILWNPWQNGGAGIELEIQKIASIPEGQGFTADYQGMVWQESLPPETTHFSIPTRFLDPDSAFELSVIFVGSFSTGGMKATRRHIFFKTNCNHEISHDRMAFKSLGGTVRVAITAEDCFSWSAKSNESWITISSGGHGTGSGSVTYSVSENWRTSHRQGTLTIAGNTVSVYQAAGATECLQDPVEVGGVTYKLLQTGYSHAESGDTVKCQYADFVEDIEFDRDVALSLVGGYDCNYSRNADFTTVKGKVVISKGRVTIEKIVFAGP